jgi:hypothetical protein
LRLAKVKGNAFESSIVLGVGGGREFGEGSNSISNVGTTKDVGKQKFTEETAVAKTMFVGKGSVFRSTFRGTGRRVEQRLDIVCGNGSAGFGGGLMVARSFQMVRGKKPGDVVLSREEADVGFRLFHIVAIKGIDKALVFKRVGLFFGKAKSSTNLVIESTSSVFRFAGKSKIIDLANHKNFVAVNGGSIDVAFMSSGFETKGGENSSDMLFPEASSFRMALESALDGKDMSAVQRCLVASSPPFGKSIIDAKEGGNSRTRGMGESIDSVTTVDF